MMKAWIGLTFNTKPFFLANVNYITFLQLEPKPKRIDPHAWVAPEHYYIALGMRRIRGELVIEPHPIFEYSRNNPPAFLQGKIRVRK